MPLPPPPSTDEPEPEKEPEVDDEKTAEEEELDEIEKIEENFENYEKADVKAETEKLQEAVIAKKMKKAELHLLEPLARVYENRH